MKVKFWLDSGANIHSANEDIFDVEKDLGFTVEEWNTLSENDKHDIVYDTMAQHVDWGYEVVHE